MSDEFQPFFSSGEADSVSEVYPNLESVDVKIEMTRGVDGQVGFKRYDETDLPSHIPCPVCGTNVSVGWKVGDRIDDRETQFEDSTLCQGQEREGKSCLVKFEIKGTAEYV